MHHQSDEPTNAHKKPDQIFETEEPLHITAAVREDAPKDTDREIEDMLNMSKLVSTSREHEEIKVGNQIQFDK
jgi:hypothetical protein